MGAMQRLDDRIITLSGIVNELFVERGQPVDLTAVVGLILMPEMKGKHLDLMAWKLGKKGEPVRLDGYVGTPLILPHGGGPVALPCEISLPINEDGIYGFYLFDREGTFGPPEQLLATYMFSVSFK
jgi:hypothetical protein